MPGPKPKKAMHTVLAGRDRGRPVGGAGRRSALSLLRVRLNRVVSHKSIGVGRVGPVGARGL